MAGRSEIIRTTLDSLRDSRGAIELSALAAKLMITPAAVCGYGVDGQMNAIMELMRPHGMTVKQAMGEQLPVPCNCAECLVFRAGLLLYPAAVGRAGTTPAS